MNASDRDVYIISDLHIGGRYPDTTAGPGARGFRICTRTDALTQFISDLAGHAREGSAIELVINGDFVDFLAEEDEPNEGNDGPVWVPFIADPERARATLDTIIDRDAPLFEALRALLAAGGRLTVLLGNHDIELSFPLVRTRLTERLDASDDAAVRLVYDGEAYVVGDAIVEHGNRYDGFNMIDHDALRRMRSLQSRRLPVPPEHEMTPPPGSRLVARLMNPIKHDYPFVDLLKPEIETVIPILLALEPRYRYRGLELKRLRDEAKRREPIEPGLPAYGGDIASVGDAFADESGTQRDALLSVLHGVLPGDEPERFLDAITADEGPVVNQDIASYGVREVLGLARLVLPDRPGLERRLPALLSAVRAARGDRSFDRSCETDKAYLEAAETLAASGFRYVVFGHTHLAKQVVLGRPEAPRAAQGALYFNTGTWADIMRFPEGIVDPANPHALDDLRAFVGDLAERRFSRWIQFAPTFVKLEVRGGRVTHGELRDFNAFASP